MEAREKAKELVDKMLVNFIDWTYFIPREIQNNHTIFSEAKQRALIAVQEILNSNPHSNPFNTEVYSTMLFWNDVKQEIEKL